MSRVTSLGGAGKAQDPQTMMQGEVEMSKEEVGHLKEYLGLSTEGQECTKSFKAILKGLLSIIKTKAQLNEEEQSKIEEFTQQLNSGFNKCVNYFKQKELNPLLSKEQTEEKLRLIDELIRSMIPDPSRQIIPLSKIPHMDTNIVRDLNKRFFLVKSIPHFTNTSTLNLIYRATMDGWHHKDMQEKCKNLGPLLFIFKSKQGRLSAGFMSKTYFVSDKERYVDDPHSFLLSITEEKKYPCLKSQYALCFRHDIGIDFGRGCLCVWNGRMNDEKTDCAYSRTHNDSFFKELSENVYSVPMIDEQGQGSVLTGGKRTFVALEIEVFHARF
ncbi:hypothetical protein FGO68_gene12402 [Halteria grandinella]|uniref:TLDc domain-containing protein n=1 Tax=Halteria grandinella TaxID=5974 RepID=A0A8J8T0G1_HALGN|nr:hypothetical protein FGO68_gene12402 [Halteria grandinella]